MSAHGHAHSTSNSSNVIHLDLASQKLLVQPDERLPEFYPPPRAVMVTPIYHDADAHSPSHVPGSAGGSQRGYRDHRDRHSGRGSGSGRRYYDDDDYDRYDRGRGSRYGGRGRYSDDDDDDDDYDGYSDDGDRKRSRPPGTEPPPLPPPDISHYPGGGNAGGSGSGRHSQGHGHGHGRAHSQSYGGRYGDDRYGSGSGSGRHHHQSNKLHKRRDYGYGSRDHGGGGRSYGGSHGRGYDSDYDYDYPPTSDSDDYYPDDRYPDDDSYYSYTGGGRGRYLDHDDGRSGYGGSGRGGGGGRDGRDERRSRPQGTEPPPLPPPDISAYPGGGHAATGGGRPPTAAGSAQHGHAPSGSGAGYGYAGSQHPASQHPASQYAGSAQHGGHAPSGYAGSHHPSQSHSQGQGQGKKPGLLGRIFHPSSSHAPSNSNKESKHNRPHMANQAVYPHTGAHPAHFMASHRPGAVPGKPAPMSVSSSSSSASSVRHVHGGYGPSASGSGGRGGGGGGGGGSGGGGGNGGAPGALSPAGTKLSPITQAFLRIAAKKGYGDEITRYISQLPPSPQFCWGRCTGGKKAVLIGINYVGMKDELKGCANDARNMRDFLVNVFHFNPANIVLITDEKDHRTQLRPTRREMFNAMAWLVHDAKKDDSLFFHYSGHGGQSKDASGREADGLDEVIYPLDYDEAGDIIDDELHDALVKPLPAGCRLTAIFDSCHSGTVLDLPYLHSAHGRLRSMQHISKRARQRGAADAADVISICACKDDETSADTHEGNVAVGAMSYALIHALRDNPDQTYEELLTHLREILIPKYHQKAQISGTHPLDLDRKFIL